MLSHGVLYTSLPTARACGRLESTLPPPSPLLAWRWAPPALRRRRHVQHEHTSLRCARFFTAGRPQGRVCGPLYSTCATARVALVMQPPRRSCSARISALTARDAWRAAQTSKQPSLLRLECFKRAPVLAHGVLYTSLPAARACGRLESTFPPPSPLLAGRRALSALRRRRHWQHEHTSLRCARSFTTGRPQGRVCGPLYSTCATARVVLVMQPPRRSCWGRISALTARDAWRATNQ